MSHGLDKPQQQSGDAFAQTPLVSSRARKQIWSAAKWSLTAIVIGFVGVRALQLWQQGSTGEIEWNIGWLILAGLLYAAGWLPSAWYYKVLLSRMGDEISWPNVIRAYYCGHLGKYVPGKALVPIIRGQMVAAAGGRFRSGALAVVYDALVMMGVGFEISIALLPFLVPTNMQDAPPFVRQIASHPWGLWILEHPAVVPVVVLSAAILSLPLVGNLFSYVAVKLAPTDNPEALTRRIDSGLIAAGFFVFSLAWVIHGLALWATLRGVGAQASLKDLPTWTACVALPMVAGFAAIFVPGGVGVREGVMIEVLKIQPSIDPRQAIASAFMLRVVGLISEVIFAALLYYGLAPKPPLRDAEPNRAPKN